MSSTSARGRRRRRGLPWALLTTSALLFSLAANLGLLYAGSELTRSDPFEVEEEELFVVDLRPDKEKAPELEPKLEPEEEKKRPEPKVPEAEELVPELEEPEPEEPEPEEPEPETERPQLEIIPPNMKMVEQLDRFDEKEAPEDANYLSNVNRDVDEETRAEVTNMERDAEEAKAMPEETLDSDQKGHASEDEIKQLREQESQLARESLPQPPAEQEQRPEQNDPQRNERVAMRELSPREHQSAAEEREDLASEAEDGVVPTEQNEAASLEAREQRAHSESQDEAYRFRLSQRDMDVAFGQDLNAPRNSESLVASKRKGVWDGPRERYQSPLENMVPEVRPGNQTALRSRKHPFARYIATIHRDIHQLWAHGYLRNLDSQPKGDPHNDLSLWTRLEIVLGSDGRIDNVKVVHHSGLASFDAAAREIIYAAGPFPKPPSAIRSGNGKVYLHWAFHRNERACGTFGAQPFILENEEVGDRPDPHHEIRLGARERLRRGNGHSHSHAHSHGSSTGGQGAKEAAAKGSGGPIPSSPPPSKGAGKTRKRGGSGGKGTGLLPRVEPEEPAKVDAASKAFATAWLRDFKAKNTPALVRRSSVPFFIGGTLAARSNEELRGLMAALADEAPAKSGRVKGVYTAATLRRELGSLPAGIREGSGRVYAWIEMGNDRFVIFLEKRFGKWRVVGLSR